MALQSLILPIVSLFRSAGITQARNALTGLNKDLKGLAGAVGKAAGSFAAFQAVTGSRQFLLDAVDSTQQFERNMLALGQVFEGLTPKMDRFTKAVNDYGIGQNQAAQASVFIGSVLKQYGFGVDEAADATQRIVKLAQDLATTYGYDVSEALLATTALFRGEFDPIEKFGVAMKQNEINAELLAKNLGHLTGAQRENAEAQITLDFLFERAADSVGAFSRATDTLYAAQKRLEAQILNLQIAFGEPLQKPLAEITNIFASLVDEYGPELAEIGDLVASGLSEMTPVIKEVGELLFELTGILSFVLEAVNAVAGVFVTVLEPAVDLVGRAVDDVGDILKAFVILGEQAEESAAGFFSEIGLTDEQIDDLTILDDFFAMVARDIDKSKQDLKDFNYENDKTARIQREVNYELQRFQLQADRSAEALIEIRKAAEQEEIRAFQEAMRGLGVDARDAEGNLIGVAKIFADIDEAAGKSNAKAELEAMNIEAGLIQAVLEEPNWQEIFGQISRYARLAAIDLEDLGYAAAVGVSEAMRIIAEGLPDLFSEEGGGGGAVTDFVQDFYDNLDDEIAKESARRKLSRMGASEGLIEAILGSGGWEEVLKRVLRDGIDGLRELQEEFNKTREGIEAITAATKAFEDAQAAALEGARKEAEAYIKEQQRIADEAERAYTQAREAADRFLERLEDFNTIEILPNIEEDIGKFETAVIGSIDRIRSELKSAFRSDLINQEDFDAISAFVAVEEFELRRLAQIRDDLANRYTLSEALINDYKRAISGALQLTTLFGQLKSETEKRTVTEVQRGIAKLGDSLREFEITVTRSYEETIEGVQDKTAGLLDGFRDMAQKSRDFAANLQKLRQLHLDPMLFDQLVRAGVIAGGETAQALVDGGADTIEEINGLFTEINQLGADLGEEIAVTMYGAGIDMTNGLLEGIKSEQETLLERAREMAQAFSAEFNKNITLAINKKPDALKKIAEDAAAAVPKLEDIDIAGLAQLNAYLENAGTALAKVKTDVVKAGISTKIAAVEELKKDILAGAKFDLSGIERGLTSAELIGRVESLRGGAQVVYNNTYNIQPGNKMQQNETIELLKRTTDQNGSLPSYGIKV